MAVTQGTRYEVARALQAVHLFATPEAIENFLEACVAAAELVMLDPDHPDPTQEEIRPETAHSWWEGKALELVKDALQARKAQEEDVRVP